MARAMPEAMIDYAGALEQVILCSYVLPKVNIPMQISLGYVLAVNVKALSPIPRFDASAVDGYVVRTVDLADVNPDGTGEPTPVILKVDGAARAGELPSKNLKAFHACRIFTGAIIPSGGDAVVMQERVQQERGHIEISSVVRAGENIRRKGEEFTRGGRVFMRGTLITPPVIGMLATLGCSTVRVYRKPRVAIVVTGDEIRRPTRPLSPGEIYDSNSFALSAALQALGILPVLTLRVGDSKAKIRAAFTHAFEKADVVISIGGVSVGEYDFVKEVCKEIGIRTRFWKVAIKPGKPNFFGTKRKKLFFGLPGNPVASLLSFHLLVRPALRKLMGMENEPAVHLSAQLKAGVSKKPGRAEFLRAKLGVNSDGNLCVTPTQGQGSHMMGGLANADCLIHFPKDASELRSDDTVTITPLQWGQL